MGGFIIIVIIGFFIWNLVQGGRISELEHRLSEKNTDPRAQKGEKTSHQQAVRLKDLEAMAMTSKSVAKDVVAPSQILSPSDFKWEDFFTKKFFAILGALSVVLAIGFFAVWAFAHGWIGPSGRIGLGILVSLILLVLGELMREKYPNYYHYLSSAGIAGLIITTFIARYVYGFLDPMQAFSAYVFEVAIGVYLALRYQSRVLGNFSILAGLIAPILVQGEPNEIGLLSYLSVLTVGGFVLSLRQKWPEILIMLFIGIIIYEGGLWDLMTHEWVKEGGRNVKVSRGFIMDQPLVFLAFSFGMHWVLGLGGVIRSVREKMTQSWDTESVDGTAVLEMILMMVSIVAFNGIAAAVFQMQEWSYLGFFLLAQGFLLFFLSEWLKAHKLPFYQRIAISGTLITVLLATILEIGATNYQWLTIALLLEGVLMVWVAGQLEDKWIGLFGRVALLLGSFYGFGLSVWWAALALVLYSLGQGIALMKAEKDWEKTLSVMGIIWGIFLILGWNFMKLANVITIQSPELVMLFILPTLLSLALAYSVIKIRSAWGPWLGVGTIILSSLALMEYNWIIGRMSQTVPVGLTILAFLLIGYFGGLSSVFLQDRGQYLVNEVTRRIMTRVVLISTTLLIFSVGPMLFDDPVTTIFWLLWGIVLLTLGIHNTWPTFRYFGIGVVLFVIGKLYLFDVWGFGTGEKVVAFSVLGLTLLGLSFYTHQKD